MLPRNLDKTREDAATITNIISKNKNLGFIPLVDYAITKIIDIGISPFSLACILPGITLFFLESLK